MQKSVPHHENVVGWSLRVTQTEASGQQSRSAGALHSTSMSSLSSTSRHIQSKHHLYHYSYGNETLIIDVSTGIHFAFEHNSARRVAAEDLSATPSVAG